MKLIWSVTVVLPWLPLREVCFFLLEMESSSGDRRQGSPDCSNYRDLCRSPGRRELCLHMHRRQRDGGNVDQIHMAIHSAVEAEVTEVRGHAVEVSRVVAEHCNRNAIGLLRLAFGRCS